MSYETNVTDFAGLQSLMSQMGSDTEIAFDPWNTITSQNVSMASLTAGDFLFN